MTFKQRRRSTRVPVLIAVAVIFTACGSSAPVRPTALDPSSPDAPEAPRMKLDGEGAAAANALEPRVETAVASSDGVSRAEQRSEAAAIYTCPMHPEVTSDHPGQCPKCGMRLILKAPVPAPNAPAVSESHGAPSNAPSAREKGSK